MKVKDLIKWLGQQDPKATVVTSTEVYYHIELELHDLYTETHTITEYDEDGNEIEKLVNYVGIN